MFSTVQLDYINGAVATMKKEGYTHYVAISDNYRTNTSSADLYIYFSKDEIRAEDLYTYFIPSDSVLYTVRTGNGSTNNTSARLSVSTVNFAEFLDVDDNEFVSTNATFLEGQVQPDFTVGEVGQYEVQGALLLTVCAFLLFMFFVKLFRR